MKLPTPLLKGKHCKGNITNSYDLVVQGLVKNKGHTYQYYYTKRFPFVKSQTGENTTMKTLLRKHTDLLSCPPCLPSGLPFTWSLLFPSKETTGALILKEVFQTSLALSLPRPERSETKLTGSSRNKTVFLSLAFPLFPLINPDWDAHFFLISLRCFLLALIAQHDLLNNLL